MTLPVVSKPNRKLGASPCRKKNSKLEGLIAVFLGLLDFGAKRHNTVLVGPKTRLSYERAFAVLKPLTEMPLIKLDRAFIFNLRDTKILPKYGTWLANYTVTVLTIALRFAEDRGWLTDNPLAQKIKKIRVARKPN